MAIIDKIQHDNITYDIQDTKAQEDVAELKSAIDGILVESPGDQETVTLSNNYNTEDFGLHIAAMEGFSQNSYSQGIYTIINNSQVQVASPYISSSCSLGTGNWLIGYKYKFTKIGEVGDPAQFRIHAGATDITDVTPVFGEWLEYSRNVTIDLTRLRIAARNFATIPAANTLQLEVKDVYVYDATGLSQNMIEYIIQQQSSNYQAGTVTYTRGSAGGLAPDTSLGISGKAADSKAVGDAIGDVSLDVTKYGVKGDGVTDDTDAINAIFSNGGVFYFPSGTYKITGTIALPENSTMYGDGDTSIIDMRSCDDLTECTFRGGEHIYPYILVGGDNTKLHDFKLVGNSTTQTKRHAGVLMMDAENCFISNLTIYNINYLANQTEPNVNAYGICVLRSYRAYIDHCYVEQCGYECIGIADSSHHCVVSNCITKNGWRTCIQVHRGAYDVDILGNQMIQDAQAWDACFTLHGLQDANLVRNLRIENNTFKATVAPRTRVEPYAAVVQLMSYCDGLWFVNNRVEAGDRDLAAESTVAHLTVMGNLFQASDTSDYRLRIVSDSPIIVGNVLENTSGTTQAIPASAIMAANIGIEQRTL